LTVKAKPENAELTNIILDIQFSLFYPSAHLRTVTTERLMGEKRMPQCQSLLPNSSLDKLTYINIGANGTLSGTLHTTTSDIDAILTYLRIWADKVVLHFHGGLVSEEAGELTAQCVVPLYKGAGAHPVVFIWETGFLETVLHNLSDIQNTALFKKILAYAVQQLGEHLGIPAFSGGLGKRENVNTIEARLFSPRGAETYDTRELDAQVGEGLSILGVTLYTLQQKAQSEVEEQLRAELSKDDTLKRILEYEVPRTELLNPDAVAQTRTEAARGVISITKLASSIARVVYHVARRYREQRDHGFSATVVEETLREFYIADLGAWVYGGMKHVAKKMWAPNGGLSGEQIHGGRYFLEGLFKLQQERPTLIIDLVGHSLGSVAICMMLQTAYSSELPLKVRNLILMAPACKSSLFYEEIVTHPNRYQKFRMFTMNNDFEKANHLLSIIYDRSLLYLVSGILEPEEIDMPLVGMMRYETCSSPFDSPMLIGVHNFLFEAAVPQRTVLARTLVTDPKAAAGFRSNAARHQDFNTDADTQNSLVEMIKYPSLHYS
jgi:pimeloyl-ACP methyl ester carboxylesterase